MSNRATFLRFLDAVNTGDPEVTLKVIDEIIEPDVLFRAAVRTGATGAEALKQVWETLPRAFPDLHVTVSDLMHGCRATHRAGDSPAEVQGPSADGSTRHLRRSFHR
jgi:hypothetical protein